ncbi:MAG: MerR family transcriptional regulator [Flavobacteriaceae bacterium]|nr:MerR family transcriptional regulator [Flavobacteriaceae bacterium]
MVKSVFSIKDLENLSGIKAHTIRIWEKRYNLLVPERTDTNIRHYNLSNLQKLLNVTQLYHNGYKISKIAKLSNEKIHQLVVDIANDQTPQESAIASFKMAMVNFDANLFHNTYLGLAKKFSFSEIFLETFVPLLNELGLLWQAEVVRPSHEHFITGLIKQTIIANIKQNHIEQADSAHNGVYVLYLPNNEIHDIGLTYIYYHLLSKKHKTIYLGQSMDIEFLKDFNSFYENIIFVTYLTVQPEPEKVNEYVQTFQHEVNPEGRHQLWLLGRQTQYFTDYEKYPDVRIFDTLYKLTQKV